MSNNTFRCEYCGMLRELEDGWGSCRMCGVWRTHRRYTVKVEASKSTPEFRVQNYATIHMSLAQPYNLFVCYTRDDLIHIFEDQPQGLVFKLELDLAGARDLARLLEE